MAPRAGGILKSYDFFGKSIPGIILISGVVSLLPTQTLESMSVSSGDINFASLAILLATLVFIGFVMGEAAHTLAVNVEKTLYWGGHSLWNFYHKHAASKVELWLGNRREGLLGTIGQALRIGVFWRFCRPWCRRRYWGIHDVFKNHRRLFENTLKWHFAKNITRRRGDEENITYHGLIDAFNNTFTTEPYDGLVDFRLQAEQHRVYQQIYPMVASEVTEDEGSRAGVFQSRYSFCRGMWVVLLILAIAYAYVFYTNGVTLFHGQLLIEELDWRTRSYLLLILGISSLSFMDAAGNYKRYYVEYLISEFYAKHGRDHEDGRESEVGVSLKRLQQLRHPGGKLN